MPGQDTRTLPLSTSSKLHDTLCNWRKIFSIKLSFNKWIKTTEHCQEEVGSVVYLWEINIFAITQNCFYFIYCDFQMKLIHVSFLSKTFHVAAENFYLKIGTISPRYLETEVHLSLLISQSKFQKISFEILIV